MGSAEARLPERAVKISKSKHYQTQSSLNVEDPEGFVFVRVLRIDQWQQELEVQLSQTGTA